MSISGRGQRGAMRGGNGWPWAAGGLALACLAVPMSGQPVSPEAAAEAPVAVTEQATDASPSPSVELRLDLMLREDRVLGETLSGMAWDVAASPGRRLMQLPLRVVSGTESGQMAEPAISFGGSRFVGWWLPIEAEATSTHGRSRGAAVPSGPTDNELLDLAGLLGKLEAADADRRRGGRFDESVEPTAAPQPVGEPLPEDAPRLAREITVTPDGTVAWEVARLIPGATVKSGETPYLLYLDGQRLRDLKPEKEAVARNADESSREFSQRRREIDIAYRDELTAFRELQQASRAVPKELEAQLPDVVWAVFEVNAIQNAWSLRGGPAGTWSMGFDEFEALRDLASGQGISTWPEQQGGRAFSAEDRRLIATLDKLAKNRHPWTQRTLARALADSGYAARIGAGDAVSDVFEQLLASPDPIARNRTVYALATTSPATLATASLLEGAAQRTGDPAVQLAALRAQLAVQLASAAPDGGGRGVTPDLSGVVATANANLANPAGADAGLVVKQLLATVPAETPEAVTALVSGVRFDGLPSGRFDAAVAAVLSSAESQPAVVGGWVDRQLLGSSNAEVVKRTLELMSSADAPAPAVSAFATALRGAVFGRSEAADAPAGDGLPRVMMTAGLPLDSTNHALFKLLNAGDPATRRSGWAVLRHFELTDRAPTRGRGGRVAPTADSELDPLTMIVDAGLGQTDTPSSLVPFLLRQPDEARANGPLLRVVLTGDTPSSRRAARALLGSERDLGPAIAELDADQRAALGNAVHDRLGDGPEPVTGLLRQENNRRGSVGDWFGEQWAAGELPQAAAWAEQAGGESALTPLVGGDDEALAHGAIAALAAAVGADRALQQKMIDRFRDQRQTLSTKEFEEAWSDARQDIYTTRLAEAAGEYRLLMTVSGETAGDGGPGRARDEVLGFDPEAAAAQAAADENGETKVVRTLLGVITLDADGRSVSIRGGKPTLSVPDDRLALRVAEPGELLAFADQIEALQDLPLDGIEEPLDLLPEEGNVWRGQVPMPDGRRFGLVMEPWSGSVSPAEEKPGERSEEEPKDGAKEERSGQEKTEG
ncbi:MAG: hypothetical protein AAF333_01880 [Planctomycetota bacterium]